MSTAILGRSVTSLQGSLAKPNPYREQIAGLSDLERNTSTWLIFAHDDPLLVMKIQDALGGHPSIVLQVPQGDWQLHRDLWVTALSEFLPDSSIRNVALIGHSQANVSDCRTHFLGSADEANGEFNQSSFDPYATLLERVRTAQQHRDLAKQVVADQFHYLAEHENLAELATQQELHLHGLFYMAESGLFLNYTSEREWSEIGG